MPAWKNVLPCESVIEENDAEVSKSKPTSKTSPATELDESVNENVLAPPEAAPAEACTNDTAALAAEAKVSIARLKKSEIPAGRGRLFAMDLTLMISLCRCIGPHL